MNEQDITGGNSFLARLPEDDPRFGPPGSVTSVSVDPKLDLLPTHEMLWPDFERLLLRTAREVRGLRAVSLFGNTGQAQDGLDAVGLNASGIAEGVQGKKYATFTKADLEAAVCKFVDGSLTFQVEYLGVGVSCEAHERKVVERLVTLNQEHRPLEIELWDRRRLSELLRDRPDIVIEFFGDATAASFCLPYAFSPVTVPPPEAVNIADAIMRGPANSSGAQGHLYAAAAARDVDPDEALKHVRRAQELLKQAGFPGHAAVLDKDAGELLVRLGRTGEAGRLLLNRMWAALRDDRSIDADNTIHEIEALAHPNEDTLSPGTSRGDQNPRPDPAKVTATIADAERLNSIAELARTALNIYKHPLGNLPVLHAHAEPELVVDHARLFLLAAEIALAEGYDTWLHDHTDVLLVIGQQVSAHDEELAVRLELAAADSTGKWSTLLPRARRRLLPRALAALVLARHARFLAESGNHSSADDAWSEAVEQGCLAGLHDDAAEWLYSRRMLASRYRGLFGEDTFHALASALTTQPHLPRLIMARATREHSLQALQDNRLREASLHLRRYLRDAVVSGSWREEHDARILLADLFSKAGEPGRAAHHLLAAGEATRAEELGQAVGDTYLEVQNHLASSNYWVRASALRLIATQADLVPDAHVDYPIEQALEVLDRGAAGTLVDTPIFDPSVFLAAHKALATLGCRSTQQQADRLLSHLAPLAPGDENTYRRTDDDHVRACVAIAENHPILTNAALDQLLHLVARNSPKVEWEASDVLLAHLPDVRERLQTLTTAGNPVATQILALTDTEPTAEDDARAQNAQAALMAPLTSTANQQSIGTGAINQSILARRLGPEERAKLVAEQLERVRSPYENACNKTDYLHAAANLAHDLPEADTTVLLPLALAEAARSAATQPDAMEGMSHPLGMMHLNFGKHDNRPAAALLAAKLARTLEQREQARNAALALIGADGDADRDITSALQVLQADLEREVPYLAGLGWALRSLAAISWAASESLDSALGAVLAEDPDPRVRRTLATALAKRSADTRTATTRERLQHDPRHSVRKLLSHTSEAWTIHAN